LQYCGYYVYYPIDRETYYIGEEGSSESITPIPCVSYINILMCYKSYDSGKRWYNVVIRPNLYNAIHI